MKPNRARTFTAVAASFAMLITACGGQEASEDTAADGETDLDTEARLSIAYPAQPPTLDPAISTASATTNITQNVWESLLTQDSDLNIQPGLAESWETSDDNLTYTFHLREGVMFHNGEELTAEDVVASMDRWSRLSNPGQAYFNGAEWRAEDDHTVVLELDSPSFGILLALSADREQFAAVMPASIVEEYGDEPVQEVVGTGPFTFDEWVVDQRITLDRWDDYQPLESEQDGGSGDRTAQLAGLDFEFVPDGSTRLVGLQTGEYDITPDLPYDNVEQVLEDETLVADSYPLVLLNLYYNKDQGVFSDVEARRAVDTALDRDSVMTAAMGSEDFYTLTHSMMLDGQSGQWASEVGADGFNPTDADSAREAVEELGYAGEDIRIITTRDYEESYTSGVVVQQQLEEIGFNATIETYDWATFSEVRDDPEAYEIATIPNTAKDDPGTLAFMARDFAGFTDSLELDELLEQYRALETLEDAQDFYDELQEWFWDYVPVSKLGDAERVYAHNPDVNIEIGSSLIWWSASIAEN